MQSCTYTKLNAIKKKMLLRMQGMGRSRMMVTLLVEQGIRYVDSKSHHTVLYHEFINHTQTCSRTIMFYKPVLL
jgi:hypothetical protein